MNSLVSRMSKKTILRLVLAGLILLCLTISSVGIFFTFKKDSIPPVSEIANPIDFSTDKWDGVTSSEDKWVAGANYGKRGEDVYTINSAEAFIYFTQLVNAGDTFENRTVYLNKNIDLNYNTIESLKNFKGTFDGAYYTIFNADIVGNGLFNETNNATIQNLGMYNCNVTGTDVAGGLIGKAVNTDVINCYVRLGEITTPLNAAGLIGKAENVTVTNSFAHATVKAIDTKGLIYEILGDVSTTNCYDGETVKTIDFTTWDYNSTYTLSKTWCDYSYAENSTELNFEYPILTRFNKVFLTGSCYENVMIKDGKAYDIVTLRNAFELVEDNEEAEVNIIVEKVFVEETAVISSTGYVNLTSSVDTKIERGKNNTDAMIKSTGLSSLVIGTKEVTKDTPTIEFNGNREYIEENNLVSDAAIVSTGYDFITHSNVMVRDNINNKTGYGGGISLIYKYNPTYTSTDEISAVGIDGTIVTNCESTKDGGGIYVGGTIVGFEPGFNLNISNCRAGIDGGGFALDLENNQEVQNFYIQTNIKYGADKIVNKAITNHTVSGGTDITASDELYIIGICNDSYAYNAGGILVTGNKYKIHLAMYYTQGQAMAGSLSLANNRAYEDGGGIYVKNASRVDTKNGTLTIAYNEAGWDYDGNYNSSGTPSGAGMILSSCTLFSFDSTGVKFFENDSGDSGGAIYINNSTSYSGNGFIGANIYNNYASYGAAIYYKSTNEAYLNNCNIYNNYSYSVINTYYNYPCSIISLCSSDLTVNSDTSIYGNTFILSNGTTKTNYDCLDTADSIIYVGDNGISKLTMLGSSISTSYGYAIRCADDSELIIKYDYFDLNSNANINPPTSPIYLESDAYIELQCAPNYAYTAVVLGGNGYVDDSSRPVVKYSTNAAALTHMFCFYLSFYNSSYATSQVSGTTFYSFDSIVQQKVSGNFIYLARDLDITFTDSSESSYATESFTPNKTINTWRNSTLSKSYNKNSVTYSIKDSSGTSQTVTYTGTLNSHDRETHAYYFDNDNHGLGASTNVTSSMTITPTFKLKTYSVNYSQAYLDKDGVLQDSSNCGSTISGVTSIDGTQAFVLGGTQHDTGYYPTLTVAGTAISNPTANPGYEFCGWKIEEITDSGTYSPQNSSLCGDDVESGSIAITAVFKVIPYSLDFFPYASATAIKGDFNIIDGGVLPSEPTLEGKDFKSWVVDTAGTQPDGPDGTTITYTLDNNDAPTKLTLSGTSNSQTFNIVFNLLTSDPIALLGVYRITSIEAGSYGTFAQDSANPILRAEWVTEYKVNILAGETVWDDLKNADNKFDEGIVVKSTDNTRVSQTTTDSNSKFPTTSETGGSDPFICNDLTTKVFNYGYEITGWKVIYNDGTEKYLTYSSNNWSDGNTPITVSDLNKDKGYLNKVAAYLDIRANVTEFTITPTWKAATIKLKLIGESEVETGTFSYNSAYSAVLGDRLENADIKKYGKSITHFVAGTNPIALDYSTWSYVGIETYNYNNNNTSTDTTDDYYTLELTPQYTNNMYKVQLTYKEHLTGIKPSKDLSGSNNDQFTLINYSKNGSSSVSNKYTFDEYDSHITEVTYNSYNSSIKTATGATANTYALAKKTAADAYNIAVDAGSTDSSKHIEIDGREYSLNRVYVNISGATGTSVTGATEFYIYLVNEQDIYNKLPVFSTQTYIQEYYINSNDDAEVNYEIYKVAASINETGAGIKANVPKFLNKTIDAEDIEIKSKWELKDGYTSSGTVTPAPLTAGYFRKFYNLSVETKLDSVIGAYGYAIIDIVDTLQGGDKSARYIALAVGGVMNYYPISSSINTYELFNRDKKDITPTTEIVIYDGCRLEIVVKDQSEDVTVDDAMVGYRYAGISVNPTDTLTYEQLDNGYKNKIEDATITEAELTHGAEIDIDIAFEKILYTTSINLVERGSGVYRHSYYNGDTTSDSTTIEGRVTLTNPIKVGDRLTVRYIAAAGWTLRKNAFVFYDNTNEKALKTYDDETNDVAEQTCVIEVTGTWLRNCYYSVYDSAYSVTNTDLPDIEIRTEKINFKWNVEVVDTTSVTPEITTKNISATWQIGDTNYWSENKAEIFAYDETMGTWYITDGTYNYAPITSHAKKGTTYNRTNILNTTYNFPLSEITMAEELQAVQLLEITNTSSGVIIPTTSRTLTLVIEARKILNFNLTIVADEKMDAERSVTSTSITNGMPYVNTADEEHKTITVYTYKGLENTLSFVYDELRYTTVGIYSDSRCSNAIATGKELGTTITHTMIDEVSDISNLYVKYEIRTLGIEFEYYIDGESTETVPATILQKLDTVTTGNKSELIISDTLTLKNLAYSQEYILTVDINETVASLEDMQKSEGYVYTVTTEDYEYEKILVKLMFTLKPAGSVTIQFVVSNNALSSDTPISSVVVKDSSQEKTPTLVPGQNAYMCHVLEDKQNVQIKVNLNKGYRYVKHQHNTNLAVVDNKSETPGEILIDVATVFKPTEHAGTYTITLAKEEVVVRMNRTNKLGTYTISTTTDSRKLNELTAYVGTTLKFNVEEHEQEQFNTFKYGETVIEGKELLVSSELLANATYTDGKYILEILVDTTPKYQLEVSNLNSMLTLKVEQGTTEIVNTSTYANNKYSTEYYVDGTTLKLTLQTTNINEATKYSIKLKNASGSVVSENVPTTGTALTTEILLTSLEPVENNILKYTVEVTALAQEITVSDYIYTTLEDFNLGTPTEVADNIYSQATISTTVYKTTSKITIQAKVYEDGEVGKVLRNIRIIQRDGTEYLIHVTETGEITGQASGYTSRYISSTEIVEISFNVIDGVEFHCEYIDVKEISQ